MAFTRKDADATAKTVNVAASSDKQFFYTLKRCLETDRIKKPSSKKLESVGNYLNGLSFVTKHTVIGNASFSTVKSIGIPTPPDTQSPLYQMNKTSKEQRKIVPLANTVWEICRRRDIEPQVYFMTVTIENCNVGQADEFQKSIWEYFRKMNQVVRSARTGRNGLNLPAVDGSNADLLGEYVSMETTVNAEKIKAKDYRGVEHPHAHDVMILDKELDMNPRHMVTFSHPNMIESSAEMVPAKAEMFKYVLDHMNLHGTKLSAKAFDFKKATTKYRTKNPQEAFVNAMVETTKYSVKPDAWGRIFASAKGPDDRFALDLFADIYNANFGKKMHRNHGVVLQARGFLNWCEKHALGSAVMNAHYKHQAIDSSIPDLMTQRASIDISKKDDNPFYSQKALNAEQLVYFNDSVIGHSGFNSALLYQVKFGQSNKAQLYEYLLKQLLFTDPGKSGLIATLDEWASALNLDLDAYKENHENFDLFNSDEYLHYRDVVAVRSAVESKLDDAGFVEYKCNWRNRAKLLNAVDMARSLGYKHEDLDDFSQLEIFFGYKDDDSEVSAQAEKIVLAYFGKLLGEEYQHVNPDPHFFTRSFDELLKALEDRVITVEELNQLAWHEIDYDAEERLSDAEWLVAKVCDADNIHNRNAVYGHPELTQFTDCKIDTAEKLQRVVDSI